MPASQVHVFTHPEAAIKQLHQINAPYLLIIDTDRISLTDLLIPQLYDCGCLAAVIIGAHSSTIHDTFDDELIRREDEGLLAYDAHCYTTYWIDELQGRPAFEQALLLLSCEYDSLDATDKFICIITPQTEAIPRSENYHIVSHSQ